MNAGFANLTTLKQHLLAAAQVSGTAYDVVLTTIGLGVAGQFEKFCNRKFARTVDDTFTFSAERDSVHVPRYPIESISAIAEKSDQAEGFVAQDITLIINADEEKGMVYFGTVLGLHHVLVRLTYTGGYFWNTLEPSETGYPTALPAGATALPDELKHAWLLQCGEVWSKRDKLGLAVASAPDDASKVNELKLIPAVIEILNSHRRFA